MAEKIVGPRPARFASINVDPALVRAVAALARPRGVPTAATRSSTAERMNPYVSVWTEVTQRGAARVPPGAAGQRPLQDAGRPRRAPSAAVYPLLA